MTSNGRFSFTAMAAALPKTETPRRSPKPVAKTAAQPAPSSPSSAAKKTLKASGPPSRELPLELFLVLSDAARRSSIGDGASELFTSDRQLSKCFVSAEDATNLGLCVGDLVVLDLEMDANELEGQGGGPKEGTNSSLLEARRCFGTLWPSSVVSPPYVVPSDALLSGTSISSGSKIRLSRYSGPPLKPLTSITVEISSGPSQKTIREPDSALLLAIKSFLAGLRFIRSDVTYVFASHGEPYQLVVKQLSSADGPLQPHETAIYTTQSQLRFQSPTPSPDPQSSSTPTLQKIDFSNIGGLDPQIAVIRDMVQAPLSDPSRFTRFGIRPPRGVLLTGPSGTGKTLLARAVISESGANVVSIRGGDLLSRFYGETESRLRAVFEQAVEKAPSIIFIDEIDTLCSKRDDSAGELDRRIVASLLTLMDGIEELKPRSSVVRNMEPPRVVVIAATNRPGALDEALRRPGRFDREIELPIPTPGARLEILKVLLKKVPTELSEDQVVELSGKTHGYVGADLAALVREAGLRAVKRLARSPEPDVELRVSWRDMEDAYAMVRPSAMREILLEVPRVRWEDIGGQSDVKQKMRESIEWPLQHPEAFSRLGIRPPKGILLYGPPGCSKTLMAKALATESGLNFLAVKGPELFSKWVGESEKAVREVFRKARAASPSIVFFDEIDALATTRSSGDRGSGSSVSDRVLSQLLTEMDGIEPLVNVTVVAATNRPDVLDPALMRPGRLDRILYVGPPDVASRREIFRISTRKMACEPDVDIDDLASRSVGLSGAECVNICQEAAMFAMEEDVAIQAVGRRHFDRALREVKPRITMEMIAFYEDFRLASKANVI